MSTLAPQIPAARQWFIQVDGQAYGPFTDEILWSFMTEGRVTAQSQVSQNPQMGYRTVAADPGLMSWLSQVPQKQAETPAPVAAPRPPLTVFMVMAEIRSGRGMDFLRGLQSLGQVQRVGDTNWVLRAEAKASDVRDVLSQPLGADDRLFILDSFANETAWFNIGADMDSQIRDIWNLQKQS